MLDKHLAPARHLALDGAGIQRLCIGRFRTPLDLRSDQSVEKRSRLLLLGAKEGFPRIPLTREHIDQAFVGIDGARKKGGFEPGRLQAPANGFDRLDRGSVMQGGILKMSIVTSDVAQAFPRQTYRVRHPSLLTNTHSLPEPALPFTVPATLDT